MADEALENLRAKVLFRKRNLRLSSSKIASESGLTPSTLSRFLNGGGGLDTDNRLRLGNWLGITTGEVFGHQSASEGSADTLDEIRGLILADAAISEDRRQELCNWFEMTYQTFTKEKNEAIL